MLHLLPPSHTHIHTHTHRFFGIPQEILPDIRSSAEIYGYIVSGDMRSFGQYSLIPRLSACVKNLFSFHSQVEGKLRGVPICGVGLCVLVTSYNSCNICNSKYVKEWNIQTVLETCYKDVHNFHFVHSVWVTSKLRWLVSGVSLLVMLRTLTALDASCCTTQDRYS